MSTTAEQQQVPGLEPALQQDDEEEGLTYTEVRQHLLAAAIYIALSFSFSSFSIYFSADALLTYTDCTYTSVQLHTCRS